MSRSWRNGSTSAHRRLRAYILSRDGYICRLAYPGVWVTKHGKEYKCLGIANSVHHLDGKAQGDNPDRMVAACMPCNLRAGDPQQQPDPPGRAMTRW